MRQLVPLPPRLAPLLLPLLLLPPPVHVISLLPFQKQQLPGAAAAGADSFPQGSAGYTYPEEGGPTAAGCASQEESHLLDACRGSRGADKESESESDNTLSVSLLLPSHDQLQQSERWPPQRQPTHNPPPPLQMCFSAAEPMLEGAIVEPSAVLEESRGADTGAPSDQLQSRVFSSPSDSRGGDLRVASRASDESRGTDLLGVVANAVEAGAEAEAASASEEGEQPWFRTADRSVNEEGGAGGD